MLFNSWEFIGLVVAAWLLYYFPLFKHMQVYVLLAASLIFYAVDSFGLLLLLLCSGFVNAFASYHARYSSMPRLYASLGVILNLLLLALFKYGGLIATSLPGLDNGIGHLLSVLPLPLGISFYTFSGISLVVDSFRDHHNHLSPPNKPSFLYYLRDTLLYICFFPKLISGPIVKSKDFFSSIRIKSINTIDWNFVFKSLVVGYFLKMVIADNLKDFTFWMPFRYSGYFGTGSLLTLLFGYSVQIFADFAGYSLIAIGVSALFGYRLPDNFRYPYISTTFREFWKRWHITLSQFLMEYLYFSLGGNRKGKIRTYINLLLTMMLGGLWHGAAWGFLIWGTYHGLCLVVERILCGRRDNCIYLGKKYYLFQISRYLSMLMIFVMVSVGWLLFKLSLSETIHFLMAIVMNFDNAPFFEMRFFPILIYIIPVIVYHLMYIIREKRWVQLYVLRFDYLIYGILLFSLLTNSGSVSQFVYFQF